MKTSGIYLTIICCVIVIGSAGCSRFSAREKELPVLENRKDFHWPQGKRAAISLTFDDARASQVDNGIPILDEYSVKATIYFSIKSL